MTRKKIKEAISDLPKSLFVCAGLVSGNTPKEPFMCMYRYVNGEPDINRELLYRPVAYMKVGHVFELASDIGPDGKGGTMLFPKKAWATAWYRGALVAGWRVRNEAVVGVAKNHKNAALLNKVSFDKSLEPIRREYQALRTIEARLAFKLALYSYLEK